MGRPVELSWHHADTTALFTTQVATDTAFSRVVFQQAADPELFVQVPDLETGTTYFWRVKVDGEGAESEWSGTWSFTMLSEPVHIPLGSTTLSEPSDESANLELPISFKWRASEGAASYSIQIDLNSEFNSQALVTRTKLTETQFELTDARRDTRYFWRVKGTHDDRTGEWSDVWSFSTAPGPSALDRPILVNPENESAALETPIQFDWQAVDRAASYTLQVSRQRDFSTQFIDASAHVTGTSFIVHELRHNTEYFWRVRAQYGDVVSEWSTVWSFETAHRSSNRSPTAVAPRNGANEQSLTPTLEWDGDDNFPESQVQVAESADFDHVVTDTAVTGNRVRLLHLSERKTYHWRVRGKTEDGFTEWSTAVNFTTRDGVPPVMLALPADARAGVAPRDTLRWLAAPGAVYRLQLSDDESFERVLVNRSGLRDTSYVFQGIEHFTTYYWRVGLVGGGPQTEWSDVYRFTSTMAVPKTVSPAHSGTVNPLSVTLTWNSVRGAQRYEVLLRSGPEHQPEYHLTRILHDTTFTAVDLDPGTRYSWSVRAVRSDHESTWAPTAEFSTSSTTNYTDDEIPGAPSFALYPNPARGQARLDMQMPTAGRVQYRIFDVLGRLVFDSGSRDLPAGSHGEFVDLSAYPAGVVFLQILTDGTTKTLPLTLVR